MDVVGELERAGEVLSPAVRAAIVNLVALLEAANARIRELEIRLGMDSTNSSRPPSQDPPGTRRQKKEPSGRKAGAQRGHKAHQRPLLPAERVDKSIPHRPRSCAHCGHTFGGEEGGIISERRQVAELPPIRAEVTEHQVFSFSCHCCKKTTKATAPAGVGAGTTFGPRLISFIATLTVRLRASRRGLRQVAGDLLDVDPPSIGTLQSLLEEVSEATLPAYNEVWQALRSGPVANVDETGWRRLLLRHWLWAAVTTRLSLYRITRWRNAAERETLLGPHYSGIVGSDRAGAYSAIPPERRQLCWAHPARDFQGWQERGGEAAKLDR